MGELAKLELPRIETRFNDGVFVKAMVCERAGTCVEGHIHRWPHTTYFATGSFRVWKDGVHLGDFTAPCGIDIAAGCKHMLKVLADGSVALCIHNVSRTGEVETVPSEQLLGV